MTQHEFAKAINVSKGSLQNWEADVSRPTYQNVMLIAIAIEVRFGVPVAWTMESEADRATPESQQFAASVGRSAADALAAHQELPNGSEMFTGTLPWNGELTTHETATPEEVAAESVRHQGLEPRTRWYGAFSRKPRPVLTRAALELAA